MGYSPGPKISVEYRDIVPCKAEEMDCLVEESRVDNYVYSCPLCNYQVDFQALNRGVGASHLRQFHGLSWLQFKRNGHRWRRMTSEQALHYQHHPGELNLANLSSN